MFRRPGKNPLENGALYDDNSPVSPYKYGIKKNDPLDPRLFETPSKEERPNDNWPQEKTSPYQFSNINQEEEPETTLGEGVTFRGELSFERLLRIDGTFEGTLISQGKVIIGPKGKVKADLNLKEAIIEGEIEGNITVQEKLQIRCEAKVKGDIKAKSLCIDDGVQISGIVQVPYED